MNLSKRTPQNCAKAFNFLILFYLLRFGLIILSAILWGSVFYAGVLGSIPLLIVLGLLIHQLDYHPAIMILACAGCFIPFVSLVIFLFFYFSAKSELANKGYVIGLLGAYPDPHKEDPIAETDKLIREGKIRMPDSYRP